MQLYYRGNYHWYLKQQWVASGLKCLGFDSETVGRLFMVQSSSGNPSNTTGCVRSALRIADLAWDVVVSGTSDGSVAVTDGSSLLLTPLALNNVPPPMSMYKHQLPSACRHSFFWPRPGGDGWGLACLLDDDRLQLVFSDMIGKPTRHLDVDISSVLSSLPTLHIQGSEKRLTFVLRGIAATELEKGRGEGHAGESENDEALVSVVLYGSVESRGWGPLVGSGVSEEEDGAAGQPDEILTVVVCLRDGSVQSSTHSRSVDLEGVSSLDTTASKEEDTRVSRIVLWPGDPASLAVSLISGHDSFGVYRWCASGAMIGRKQIEQPAICSSGAGRGHDGPSPTSIISCPPESCIQIAVIPAMTVPDTEQQSESLQAPDVFNSDVIIGLTARGKLYCGETLLVAGVSSFTINSPLQVLLYISTGTKPLLHFCSFAALR